MTIEGAIKYYEGQAVYAKDHGYSLAGEWNGQIAAWLHELAEKRKEPEIIRCGECRHKGTKNCVANTWATIFGYEVKDDFYCGLVERRTE